MRRQGSRAKLIVQVLCAAIKKFEKVARFRKTVNCMAITHHWGRPIAGKSSISVYRESLPSKPFIFQAIGKIRDGFSGFKGPS
jgi:hypothetical protein